MKSLSLSKKLSLSIGLVLVIVFLILTFIVVRFSMATTERSSNSSTSQLLQMMTELSVNSMNNSVNNASVAIVESFQNVVKVDPENVTQIGGFSVPTLTYNGQSMSDNYKRIDEFKEFALADATIFVKDKSGNFIRYTTTLISPKGERAVGTKLDSEAVLESIRKGESFSGKASIFGRDYLTKYVPMLDEKKNIVGIFFVGVEFTTVVNTLAEAIDKLNLNGDGYIYIMNTKGDQAGHFVIHPKMQGENGWGIQDVKGRFFNQEIAKKLNGTIEFTTKETGNAVRMTSSFIYYEPWDWLVVKTMPMSEMTKDATAIGIRLTIYMLVFLIVILVFNSFIINKLLVKPLNSFIAVVDDLTAGDGDLTKQIPVNSNDELGILATKFNKFISNIREIVQQVQYSADEVASGNNQLAATMEEFSNILQGQTKQLSEISQHMEEVSSVSTKTVKSLENSKVKINETNTKSAQGRDNIKAVITSINDIKEKTQYLAEIIESISAATVHIGEMLTVINDIADRTNLLSLNASIEAARAGEAGRGFAVVADEVRKLAESTQSATSTISSAVNSIQAIPKKATSAMDVTLSCIQEGVGSADVTDKSFSQIVQLINELEGHVINISKEASDQYTMIEQSNNEMIEVSAGLDKSGLAIDEVAKTVDHLQSMSENLKNLVAKFKVQ